MAEQPKRAAADRAHGQDQATGRPSRRRAGAPGGRRSQYDGRSGGPFAPPAADASGLVVFAGGLSILFAVWLFMAPTVLNYDSTGQLADAYWNDRVTAVTVALLAILRVALPDRLRSLSWVSLLLGGWLIAAPFVLGYNAGVDAPSAMANDIIVGACIVLLSLASLVAGMVANREPSRDDATED